MFAALGAVWLLMAAVGLIGLWVERVTYRTSCLGHGDSNYGRAEWSWFPIGTDCTYTRAANGIDAHKPASWGTTVYLSVVVLAGLALMSTFVVVRRSRRHVSPA